MSGFVAERGQRCPRLGNDFTQELDRFWDQLIGPDEHLRRQLIEMLGNLTNWRQVTIMADGRLVMQFEDGSKREVNPPNPAETAG